MEFTMRDDAEEVFEHLDITNSVVFALVMMHNPDLFRRVVEVSIGREVDEIEVVTTENTIITGISSKSVRLDATARSQGKVFDVEMQVSRVGDVARRSRYYHSLLDTDLLGRGEDYGTLPDSYVIFVGFGRLLRDELEPRPVRRFEMRDTATGDALGDGTRTVVLDASAWQAADGDLRGMLELIRKGSDAESLSDEDGLAAALQSAVEQVRESEGSKMVMTAAMRIDLVEREITRKNEALARKDEVLARKDEVLAHKDEALARKDEVLARQDEELARKDEELARKDEENARLNELLREHGIQVSLD